MSQTRTEYATALLEENDWQLARALTALRRRLTEAYTSGGKSFADLIDIATDIAHELHLQAAMHDQSEEKRRSVEAFRERYRDVLPPRGVA